jgi:hypothetical protein
MGGLISIVDQNIPLVKAKWSVQQIPDQTGKVVIITGANSGELLENQQMVLKADLYMEGIGKSTAKVIAKNENTARLY